MLVAIILSLITRNTVRLPQSFSAGIAFGVKRLLRLGIILMGIRLSVFSVLEISLLALGMVILCIVSALATTVFIARRIGVSERLGTLIAAGTSICGVSAIVATSPAINAKEEETTYAVGTITICGVGGGRSQQRLACYAIVIAIQPVDVRLSEARCSSW